MHGIPHLVWYRRAEQRIVEYGSSFGAIRAAGTIRSIRDTIFSMNREHLSPDAVTVFEASEDAGLRAACVNLTCYRGRTRHLPVLPGVPAAYGPSLFFFYSLFESRQTGAPLAVRNRAAGSIDAYAAAVGRWLVTRDAFDLFAFYLSDLDFASHALGPDSTAEALARVDESIWTLLEAAGGPDEFLDRYAVCLLSDHGQTRIERATRLRGALRRARRHRRHGVEPGRPGLPASRRRRSTRARSPSGSTATRTSRSRSSARATRRSRGARARSSASRATATASARAATRRSSTTRTGSSAPGRRSRTRTPATCSSRPSSASSSPTSADGTTPAAAATARSRRATRRCPC